QEQSERLVGQPSEHRHLSQQVEANFGHRWLPSLALRTGKCSALRGGGVGGQVEGISRRYDARIATRQQDIHQPVRQALLDRRVFGIVRYVAHLVGVGSQIVELLEGAKPKGQENQVG